MISVYRPFNDSKRDRDIPVLDLNPLSKLRTEPVWEFYAAIQCINTFLHLYTALTERRQRLPLRHCSFTTADLLRSTSTLYTYSYMHGKYALTVITSSYKQSTLMITSPVQNNLGTATSQSAH